MSVGGTGRTGRDLGKPVCVVWCDQRGGLETDTTEEKGRSGRTGLFIKEDS